MNRYLIERTFPEGLSIPMTPEGRSGCSKVVEVNASEGVTWVHSYVSQDLGKTFCVYDGPSPEAIREVASKNNQPVGNITPVRVLDPYFYRA